MSACSQEVVEQLNNWWRVAKLSEEAGKQKRPAARWRRAAEASGLSEAKTDDIQATALKAHKQLMGRLELSKNAYFAVFMRIFKALLEEDEVWDEHEADELVAVAWVSDAHNKIDSMTHTEFNDALFECADMWTMTTEPQEYADFLRQLLWALCNGDPANATDWAPIDDVGRLVLNEYPSIAHMTARSETQGMRKACVKIQGRGRARKAKQELNKRIALRNAARLARMASSRNQEKMGFGSSAGRFDNGGGSKPEVGQGTYYGAMGENRPTSRGKTPPKTPPHTKTRSSNSSAEDMSASSCGVATSNGVLESGSAAASMAACDGVTANDGATVANDGVMASGIAEVSKGVAASQAAASGASATADGATAFGGAAAGDSMAASPDEFLRYLQEKAGEDETATDGVAASKGAAASGTVAANQTSAARVTAAASEGASASNSLLTIAGVAVGPSTPLKRPGTDVDRLHSSPHLVTTRSAADRALPLPSISTESAAAAASSPQSPYVAGTRSTASGGLIPKPGTQPSGERSPFLVGGTVAASYSLSPLALGLRSAQLHAPSPSAMRKTTSLPALPTHSSRHHSTYLDPAPLAHPGASSSAVARMQKLTGRRLPPGMWAHAAEEYAMRQGQLRRVPRDHVNPRLLWLAHHLERSITTGQ